MPQAPTVYRPNWRVLSACAIGSMVLFPAMFIFITIFGADFDWPAAICTLIVIGNGFFVFFLRSRDGRIEVWDDRIQIEPEGYAIPFDEIAYIYVKFDWGGTCWGAKICSHEPRKKYIFNRLFWNGTDILLQQVATDLGPVFRDIESRYRAHQAAP